MVVGLVGIAVVVMGGGDYGFGGGGDFECGGGNVHNGRGKVGGVIGRMAMSLLEHHLSRRSPPRFSGICRRRLRS